MAFAFLSQTQCDKINTTNVEDCRGTADGGGLWEGAAALGPLSSMYHLTRSMNSRLQGYRFLLCVVAVYRRLLLLVCLCILLHGWHV